MDLLGIFPKNRTDSKAKALFLYDTDGLSHEELARFAWEHRFFWFGVTTEYNWNLNKYGFKCVDLDSAKGYYFIDPTEALEQLIEGVSGSVDPDDAEFVKRIVCMIDRARKRQKIEAVRDPLDAD